MDKRKLLLVFASISIFLKVSDARPKAQKNDSVHVQNPFVGFLILPHGGITLDPENMDYSTQPAFREESKEKSIKLHKGMQSAAEALIKSKPDLIIFSTPHGYHLDERHLILSAPSVYGDAGGIWDKFSAYFEIDTHLSQLLYGGLKAAKHRVEILSLGVGGEQMELRWAEVIPWYFLLHAATAQNFTTPKAIYIGQPPVVDIDNLKRIGSNIVDLVLQSDEFRHKRIAVVISGDMSHYHSDDPNSPYPYSAISTEFDQYLVDWANLDKNREKSTEASDLLYNKAGNIQDEAGHCGYTGFVMLNAMMDKVVQKKWNYKSKFYVYEAPTYFGMMVASWMPESGNKNSKRKA